MTTQTPLVVVFGQNRQQTLSISGFVVTLVVTFFKISNSISNSLTKTSACEIWFLLPIDAHEGRPLHRLRYPHGGSDATGIYALRKMLKDRSEESEVDLFADLEAIEVCDAAEAIRMTASWRTVKTFFEITFEAWVKHATSEVNVSGDFVEKPFFSACNDDEERLTKLMQTLKQGLQDHKEAREAAVGRTPGTEARRRFRERERVSRADLRDIRSASQAMRDADDAEDVQSGSEEEDYAEGEDEDEEARLRRRGRGPGRRGVTTAAGLEESKTTLMRGQNQRESKTQLAVDRQAHQIELERRQLALEELKVQQEDRRLENSEMVQRSIVNHTWSMWCIFYARGTPGYDLRAVDHNIFD